MITLNNTCDSDVARSRGAAPQQGSFGSLAMWVVETFKQSSWSVLPTDKDGGYCIVPTHVLTEVEARFRGPR